MVTATLATLATMATFFGADARNLPASGGCKRPTLASLSGLFDGEGGGVSKKRRGCASVEWQVGGRCGGEAFSGGGCGGCDDDDLVRSGGGFFGTGGGGGGGGGDRGPGDECTFRGHYLCWVCYKPFGKTACVRCGVCCQLVHVGCAVEPVSGGGVSCRLCLPGTMSAADLGLCLERVPRPLAACGGGGGEESIGDGFREMVPRPLAAGVGGDGEESHGFSFLHELYYAAEDTMMAAGAVAASNLGQGLV